MTRKDLYSTVLKVAGIIYLITLLPIIPILIIQIIEHKLINMIIDIVLYGIQVSAVLLMIFKSNYIISVFKMNAQSEEEIDISFSSPNKTKIIEIAIVLFALFIAIKNGMELIKSLFYLFRMSVNPSRHMSSSYFSDPSILIDSEWNQVYKQLFVLICAFLLISFHTKITTWVMRISGDNEKYEIE
jgi:phosphatidylglycerophosphate synthase